MTLLQRLARLDTCAVADALDKMKLRGAVVGIRPVWPCPRISGRAVTVKLKPVGLERPTQHLGAPAIDAAGEDDLLVVDNAGRLDVASWGGILSLAARRKRIGGVVIDGVCRDIDEIQGIGFPVYARGVVPITARGRIMQDSFNQEIQCGGVAVRPGDLVIADGSGVAFIPGSMAEAVVAAAEAISQHQQKMAAEVSSGHSVSEVMERAAYETMLLGEKKS
jgi:regulator of RNase E activity RraA